MSWYESTCQIYMNKTLITKGQWSSVFDLFDKFCSFNVFFHFLLHQTYFLVFTQIRTRGLKINFVRDWKSWNWKESGKFSLVKLVDSSSLNMRKTFHLPLSCIGCLACLAKMTVCRKDNFGTTLYAKVQVLPKASLLVGLWGGSKGITWKLVT